MYAFNTPTFGPGVVYDVDTKIRTEQFRWFVDALKKESLKKYVPMFVMEAEVSNVLVQLGWRAWHEFHANRHMPCKPHVPWLHAIQYVHMLLLPQCSPAVYKPPAASHWCCDVLLTRSCGCTAVCYGFAAILRQVGQ